MTSSGALADLVAVMDRLRSPGGCPWDAEQSHASLVPYAVEEVFEVVEAIETEDQTGLREELGDLLLQVVFHARIAQEHPSDPFDLDDVAAGIAAKLRRRHPHVFAEATVRDAAHVSERWDEIKREEKARGSAMDGIPAGLPALARAQAVLSRSRRAGLAEVIAVDDLLSGGPGQSVPPVTSRSDDVAGIGTELLALARRAEVAGVDAEAALRAAVRGLEVRLRAAEGGAGDARHVD